MKSFDRRQLPVLLTATTLIPVMTLGWLGARMLQQDRELERQRQRERLEVAAARVALEVERSLQMIEQDLAAGIGVRLLANGIDAQPESPILFQPIDAAPLQVISPLLEAAEVDEFQRRDLPNAALAYRRAADSGVLAVRAAALVALGRVLRVEGDLEGALRAFDDLASLGPLLVAGQPADLVARQGRIKVFEVMARHEMRRAEIDDLARGLHSGRWRIDRSTFELYRELLVQWGALLPPTSAVAPSEAANTLWRAWREGELGSGGRRLLTPIPGVNGSWTSTSADGRWPTSVHSVPAPGAVSRCPRTANTSRFSWERAHLRSGRSRTSCLRCPASVFASSIGGPPRREGGQPAGS